MSRSKQIAVFLSLAIVFVLLAACTPPPAAAPAATQPAAAQPAATEAPKVVPTEAPKEAPKAEKLKIAYIRPTNEPYYKYGFDGAQMLADKAGVDLLGYVSEMKPERELASVEDAITQKVDGIVLMSVSATSLAASLNAAKDAGIPVYMLFGYNKDLMDKMVGLCAGGLQPLRRHHRRVGRQEHPRGRGRGDHGPARPRRCRMLPRQLQGRDGEEPQAQARRRRPG